MKSRSRSVCLRHADFRRGDYAECERGQRQYAQLKSAGNSLVVTSLEPDKPFSEICETLVVNAHGCVCTLQ